MRDPWFSETKHTASTFISSGNAAIKECGLEGTATDRSVGHPGHLPHSIQGTVKTLCKGPVHCTPECMPIPALPRMKTKATQSEGDLASFLPVPSHKDNHKERKGLHLLRNATQMGPRRRVGVWFSKVFLSKPGLPACFFRIVQK